MRLDPKPAARLAALALAVCAAVRIGVAVAQPAGSGIGDFSTVVTGAPVQVIPPSTNVRSQIILQNQGAAAVACRPDGTPGFGGGSIVLKGDSGTPAAGGSATLTGAAVDGRAWLCVAYPVGGNGSSMVTAKVF